jgi:hypothetical protein
MRRRWKSPPTTEELAQSVASLEGSIEALTEIKRQLDEAYAALSLVEGKASKVRSEIERLYDRRQELIAAMG